MNPPPHSFPNTENSNTEVIASWRIGQNSPAPSPVFLGSISGVLPTLAPTFIYLVWQGK